MFLRKIMTTKPNKQPKLRLRLSVTSSRHLFSTIRSIASVPSQTVSVLSQR